MEQDLEDNTLIKHVDSLILVDDVAIEHPENLIIKPLSGKMEFNPKPIATKGAETQVDETDRKIAKILSLNSRTPFRRIAKHLDISVNNAIGRYQKLRGNVSTLSTITVNLNKLGFKGGAYLFIKLENKGKASVVATELLKIQNLESS